jgi:hypothetical protein
MPVGCKNDYLERLAKAIQHLHGAMGVHLSSEPVTETFNGKVVWQGEVEVFSITGHPHPKAQLCYAWSYQDGNTGHFSAVLQVPPIRTALDAVRAHVVADLKKRKSN